MTKEVPSIKNIDNDARKKEQEYNNPFHQDSFLYKWVEFMQEHVNAPPTFFEVTGLMILACLSPQYIFKNSCF